MATIMSTGQITLVDLTDQRTSSFYLQADKSKIQTADVNKNPTTYSPDYTQGNLVITPAFFFGNDKVELNNSQIEYYINSDKVDNKVNSDTENTASYNFYQKDGKLYIKQNIPSFGSNVTQLRIRAVVPQGAVTDNETGLATGSAIEATIEFALVETGRAGQSVSKIETYYKTSREQVAPAIDNTWTKDATTLILSATDKYLWAYQKTYYKDNIGTETPSNGNVFLAGTYGDTGSQGNAGTSVKSITEQYYISTSETEAKGGQWSNTAPTTLTADKYLWTRTEIIYQDYAGNETTSYQPNSNGKCDYTWNIAVKEVAEAQAALNALSSQYTELQKQVDGAIDTWYGETEPTPESYPTTEWTDKNTKLNHNGDLYYNTQTGAAYRYTVVVQGEEIVESWVAITDAALTEALKEIEEIGAKADKKMTIYYVEPPAFPEEAELGDLWLQGANGDQYKCIKEYDKNTTLNSNNWTTYWGLANQSIGKVDIQFTKNDSATVAPGNSASWTTESPAWEQGKYIWQRTVTYDRSNNILTTSDPVCITSASRSITGVTNFYLASKDASGVTIETAGWTSDVSKAVLDETKKYLWNYEKVEYTYGDPDVSAPTIIGNYSKDGANGSAGRGIKAITEYYLISNSSSKPNFAINSSTGIPTQTDWKNTLQVTTDDKPYLWNAEVIEYTSGTKYEAKDPALIGYRGVGVKNTEVYYKRTNDSSNAPSIDTTWSTSFVDVDINNKYLWSYTKTTFTNNDTKNSTPVIIAKYVEDGASAVFAIVESTNKTIFTDQDADTPIYLQARLMIGGTQHTDGVAYSWTKMGDSKVIGTGSTLNVDRGMVVNVATFICTITHNTYAPGAGISDRITVQDKKDPVWCEIVSSNGDKFTNGNTSTTLTANLFGSVKGKYSNEEMAKYYFNWKQYDKNGTAVAFTPVFATNAVGQTNYKNAIVITDKAINSKAIFTVEVTEATPKTT